MDISTILVCDTLSAIATTTILLVTLYSVGYFFWLGPIIDESMEVITKQFKRNAPKILIISALVATALTALDYPAIYVDARKKSLVIEWSEKGLIGDTLKDILK